MQPKRKQTAIDITTKHTRKKNQDIMISTFLKRLGWFMLLLALQVLVFDHVHILGYATPFIAVYFVILFPSDAQRSAMLLWSFAFGFIADTFTNTPGVATASLTATAMIQPWLLKINSMTEDDETIIPSARKMGWGAYMRYVVINVVFCEIIFFALEAFSFFNWQDTLINIGGSSLLTILIISAIEGIRTSGNRRTE